VKTFSRLSLLYITGTVALLQGGNCPDGSPGTTIFFVNGVQKNHDQATRSLNTLRDRVSARLRNGGLRSSECLAFVLAFNPTGGLVRDLWVSTKQALGNDVGRFLRLLGGEEVAPVLFQTALTSLNWSRTDIGIRDQHVAAYLVEIQQGNTVIAVSHSQGNFYANESFRELIVRGQSLPDPSLFNIVAVATPASNTEGGAPYTTLCSDFIWRVPFALTWNVTNNALICNSILPLGQVLLEHAWDKYLKEGTASATKILDDVEHATPIRNPAFGNLVVKATLDGQGWPTAGQAAITYNVVGPHSILLGQFVPRADANVPVGQYTLVENSVSGGPPEATLDSVSPSATQFLSASQTVSFTLRYSSKHPTAGFLMSAGSQSATDGQALSLAVVPGGTVNVSFDGSSPRSTAKSGSVIAWRWAIDGAEVATTSTFSRAFASGRYDVSLSVKDDSGLQSPAVHGMVIVSERVLSLTATCKADADQIFPGQSVTVATTTSGGVSPYQYSFNGGAYGLASAQVFDEPLTAVPGLRQVNVSVKDARAQAANVSCGYAVVARPTLSASCAIDPNPIVLGQGATVSAQGNGGLPPYKFQMANGLPFGNISSIAVLPSTTGTFTYSLVMVMDSQGQTAPASCSAQVNPPPPPPPLIASCFISPNPMKLSDIATVFASASGGSGGYLYSINGGLFQNSTTLLLGPQDVGTVTASVSVKDTLGSTAGSSCSATVNGTPPTVTSTSWDSPPHNRVNFSGTISGTAFTSSSTVWFCVSGTNTCFQHPAAGVTVQNFFVIRVVDVNITTANWQVEIRTPYGPGRSSSFAVVP